MADLRSRRPRLRLDPDSYRKLRTEVLQRDGWRCQTCGRPDRPQIHHIRSRGRLGDDTDENLITLCADCHSDIHRSCAMKGAGLAFWVPDERASGLRCSLERRLRLEIELGSFLSSQDPETVSSQRPSP